MAISSKSGLPARTMEEAFAAARGLPDNKSEAMLALLSRMDAGFWQKLRKIQSVTLFPGLRGTCLSYKDVSRVMDVSKGLVSRIKRYYEEHPEKVFRDPGRPSLVGDVFGQIKKLHPNRNRRGALCDDQHPPCQPLRRVECSRVEEEHEGVHAESRLLLRLRSPDRGGASQC